MRLLFVHAAGTAVSRYKLFVWAKEKLIGVRLSAKLLRVINQLKMTYFRTKQPGFVAQWHNKRREPHVHMEFGIPAE